MPHCKLGTTSLLPRPEFLSFASVLSEDDVAMYA